MSLVFHDGFENKAALWDSMIGTPQFNIAYANTGNRGMRCQDSGGSAQYVAQTSLGIIKRISVYIYIASAPGSDIPIIGIAGSNTNLRLTSDRYLKLYYTTTLKDTGTTQLSTSTWYRISISVDSSGNGKAYLGGVEECTGTGFTTGINAYIGLVSGDTSADLYFDDVAVDDTSSTDDLGNILTLAARPTANGSDQDFGSNQWQQRTGGSDTSNNPSYADLAEDPPDTDQGAWEEANNTAHYYSLDLDDCGSGNLSDIGGSDTIHAVNFLFYYETDGGGTGAYYMYGRDTSGRSSTVELDDIKTPTWITQYATSSWDDDASAWSQSEFDDQEMGMMCQDANKDMWWYEAYAMVAFEPAAGPVALTGTCDAQSTISGDLNVIKLFTGTCDAQSTADADLSVEKEFTGTCDAQSNVSGDLSVIIELTGTITAQSGVTGDIEVEKEFTGTCDAQSTIDADLDVEKLLAGTIDAQSVISGDIEVEKLLTGSIAAQSTVDGELTVQVEIDGSIAAQSDLTGELSVLIVLTGSIAAQSDVSGDIEKAVALDGTVDATTTVDGDIEKNMALDGTIDAQTTVDADLDVEKLLTGTIDAQSTVDGEITLDVQLTGTIEAQSGVSGDIEVAKEITGTIDAQSTVDGDIEKAVALDGTIAAQSTVDGELTVEGGTIELTGTIDAQSGVSGDIEVEKLISGTVTAQSGADATLTTFAFLTGSIVAQSAAAATGLEVLKNLTGTIAASGSVAGNILVIKLLTGSVLGVSNLTGNLTGAGVEEADIDLPEDFMWIADMINEDGRSMTITVPGGPINPAEPWRGNTPGSPVGAKGIFVGHTANEIAGDHVKRNEQKLLVAPASNVEIHKGTKIHDTLDDSDWYVESFKKITEETNILLYILKVKQ